MSKEIIEVKDVFFLKKVDVKDVFLFAEMFRYRMSKQMMEIKVFFFKKVMENFVRKNIEMFLKENFVVNLDFLRRNLKLI